MLFYVKQPSGGRGMRHIEGDASTIAHALSGASVPVFLAGFGRGKRPKLIVYTAFKGAGRKLLPELKAGLADLGLPIEVREERALDDASSLEGMLNRLALERIVYDPLGIFGRAREYVAFAGAVREGMGKRL